MAGSMDAQAQLERLARNAAQVIPRQDLLDKLATSAAEVTLGWAVVLWKLREFQDLGHTAVLIVGDFTARVGDPSGKSETRPRLDKEKVQEYADALLNQFRLVL